MSNSKISRREMMKLTAAGAAGLTFLQRRSSAQTLSKESFLDLTAVERIADRDTATLKPPLLIDLQTHIWWRAGGIAKMSQRGEGFLKTLAGGRGAVVC